MSRLYQWLITLRPFTVAAFLLANCAQLVLVPTLAGQPGQHASPQESGARFSPEELKAQLRLIGTVVVNRESAWAIIENPETRRQQLYRLRQMVLDSARLVRIERDRVVLAWESPEKTVEIVMNAPTRAAGQRGASPDVQEEEVLGLADPDPEVRWAAIEEIGEEKDPYAVPPLLQVLAEDPRARMRQAAAFALGRQGDARALDPLLNALKDPEATVREGAVTALGWLKAPEALSKLQTALKDPDARVRWAAASALRRLRQ